MSKFDFEYMRTEEFECICYNKSKWTKEQALKQSIFEFNSDEKFEVYEGYARFGFLNLEGDLYNTWYCSNPFADEEEKIKESKIRNKVAVWIVIKSV